MGKIDTRLTKVLQIVKTGTSIPVIVETIRPPSSSDVQELNSEMSVKRVSKIANQVYGTADEDSIKNIARFAFVSTVFYDEPVARFQFLAPSISISKTDIHIPISDVAQFVGATDLHDEDITGKGIKVAVIDTGVNKNHPLLEGAVRTQINIVKKYQDELADDQDRQGHGTWCATALGGRDRTIYSKLFGKNIRMHGVAPECEIIGIKVLDDEGSGQTSWVIEGMEAAVEAGADIISMSLGSMWDGAGLTPDSKVVDEIVFNRNILCAIAAGNSFANMAIGSPGGSHGALTVGSNAMRIPSPGIVSTFSSKGTTTDGRVKPDISAPGGNIVNIKEALYGGTSGEMAEESGEDYISIMGTSMATPVVAGCLALLLQSGMKRDRYFAEDLIGNTARFQHPKDLYTGWGMINVKKAYEYLIGNKKIYPISTVSRIIDIPLRPLASLIPQSEQSIDSKRIRLPYIR